MVDLASGLRKSADFLAPTPGSPRVRNDGSHQKIHCQDAKAAKEIESFHARKGENDRDPGIDLTSGQAGLGSPAFRLVAGDPGTRRRRTDIACVPAV